MKMNHAMILIYVWFILLFKGGQSAPQKCHFHRFQLACLGMEILPSSQIRNWNSKRGKGQSLGLSWHPLWPLSRAYLKMRIREDVTRLTHYEVFLLFICLRKALESISLFRDSFSRLYIIQTHFLLRTFGLFFLLAGPLTLWKIGVERG